MNLEDTYDAQIHSVSCSVIRMRHPGQDKCGDRYLIKEVGDKVLLAAIDGLGHGMQAEIAGKIAVSILDVYGAQLSLVSLINKCHKNLLHTRGVVLTMAMINTTKKKISWLGVGNVRGMLIRNSKMWDHSTKYITTRGGVVGHHLPSMFVKSYDLQKNDLIILATDGINKDFLSSVNVNLSPKKLTSSIADNHYSQRDDALVLAARYLGDET